MAPPAGCPAPIALPHELFSNETLRRRRTSASIERPGKWDFQSGTRGFGAPEILECYVTVRRSAAAREFKAGPRLGSGKI
jgi:hypothetical protein